MRGQGLVRIWRGTGQTSFCLKIECVWFLLIFAQSKLFLLFWCEVSLMKSWSMWIRLESTPSGNYIKGLILFTHFGLWELLPANRIMRRKSSRETFSFKFSELLLWKQIYTEGSHSSSKDTESTLVPFYVHVLDGFLFFDFLGRHWLKNIRKMTGITYLCNIFFSMAIRTVEAG